MKSKTLLAAIAVLFLIAGCAGKPIVTGKIESAENSRDLAKQLYATAKKCWERSWNLFRDGVIVENRVELAGVVISATRHAPDLGRLRPFVRITVSEGTSGKTLAEVEEVKIEGMSGDDLAKDVRRWVNGDQRCKVSA